MDKKIMPAGVVIFVVWRKRTLLILRDDKPDISFPNTWTPVTGGLEEDEDIWVTAHRESKEEIGIIPEIFSPLGISPKGNGFFFCRLSDKEKNQIELGEGQKFDFFSWEELQELKIGGAFAKYLERFPEPLQRMIEEEIQPHGHDLELATWNGHRPEAFRD